MQYKLQEKKFYDRLRDVFVGEPTEGKGGHINLLKIKHKYYTSAVNTFKKDIDKHFKEQDNNLFDEVFKEELFEKLHHFFEKYFSESGSIYFTHTAAHDRVYEQVYQANQDVALFWKTQMLYYVKSEVLFKEATISIPDTDGKEHAFRFLVDALEVKQNNEKKELLFTHSHSKEHVHYLNTTCSERGNKTKTEEIASSIQIDEDIVIRAIRQFKRQSEVDFFINKNASAFLHKQLDMYMYQYIYDDETKFTERRILQINTIRKFSKELINFIGQFEDELVRVWNKPKFAKHAHYVLSGKTLSEALSRNKLSDMLLQKIEAHPGMDEQIKEWKVLELIAEDFNPLLNGQNYLPIDTKHFKDLEQEILASFAHIEKSLDGWLVHSDNYQALNTLREKYRGQVKCIYIDPPFNLGHNASFAYNVNYKDATWATLLENRLQLAYDFLHETGSIFVRCDYNGNHIVRMLLDNIFGKDNFRNEIVIGRLNKQGAIDKRFNSSTETLYFYSKDMESNINPQFKNREKNTNWLAMHSPNENKNSHSVEFNDKTYIAPKGRHWSFAQKTVYQLIAENRIKEISKEYTDVYGNNQKKMLAYKMSNQETIESNWTDIPGYTSTTGFQTENSEVLLERVIRTATQERDLVMDFFMGSATTQAVAHKLKRKWIGIEMGKQMHEVCIPRMKKVFAGKQKGISKALGKDVQRGGFFKYYALEQYEETLSKAQYKDHAKTDAVLLHERGTPYQQYVFFADPKLAHVLNTSTSKGISIQWERLYANIDLAETLSQLYGMPIKHTTANEVVLEDSDGNEKRIPINTSKMNDNEKLTFIRRFKKLLWWGKNG